MPGRRVYLTEAEAAALKEELGHIVRAGFGYRLAEFKAILVKLGGWKDASRTWPAGERQLESRRDCCIAAA